MLTFNRRTVVVGSAVAAAAVAVNAGVAWALWRVEGSGTASATATTVVKLKVSGTTSPTTPLYPGAKVALTVTIKNPNPFPIHISAVAPGEDLVVADKTHRKAGCVVTGVQLSKPLHSVPWPVGKGATETFTLLEGVTMTNASDSACQGATFTVPIQVSGSSTA